MTQPDLVRFCRYLRANGYSAGVTESLAAADVVGVVEPVDPAAVRWALRAALSSSEEEWDSFDRLFDAFWNARRMEPNERRKPALTEPRGFWTLTGEPGGEVRPTDREAANIAGASDYARLKKVDFSEVPLGDQPALDQLAQRLLKQMSWRLSRRRKPGGSRGVVDLRRTIRCNISRGGNPLKLRYKDRQRRQARIVILLDISGSMSLYSMFLLKFAHALHRHFRRAETFVFSTRLVRIGPMLAIAQSGGGHASTHGVPRRLVGRHQNRRVVERVQREACQIAVARYCVDHSKRWVGYREPRRVGRGVARHQKPRAQADLAESAAGPSGLPAAHPRNGRRPATRGCVRSGAFAGEPAGIRKALRLVR